MKKIRILMLADSLGKGGKERRLLEIVKALSVDDRYQVSLVVFSEKIDYPIVHTLPVTLKVLNRKHRFDLSVIFKLRQYALAFKPDIYHSWGSLSSLFLCIVMPFSLKNLINGFVADAPAHVRYFDKYYLRLLFTSFFSRYVISNSRAGLSSYRVPPHKGICIYNGVDFGRFSNLPDPSVHLDTYFKEDSEGRFIVIMVASFSIFKDYATLIKVADILCREDSTYAFLLVGKGDKLEKVRSSVPSEWLGRNIILTGMIDHVESLLQIAQVGVLLTNTKIIGEGVSNSIIEYMAMGKPVIATRCAGNEEVVVEGENGFLVSDGDVNAIANHIRLLKSNKGLRDELGRNGRRTVQEKFDLVRNVKHYCDLYDKMVRE